MSKILLVEDEENIRLFTKINLEREGFEVLEAESGEIGVELALKYNPQVVILDVMLPGIDGFEVCKILREKLPKIGIIMLTAKTQDVDRINGLESGTDDYLSKPFNPVELILRIKSLIRRLVSIQNSSDLISIYPFKLDLYSKNFYKDGKEIELTPTELTIITIFMSNPGRAFSRNELLNMTWGEEFDGDIKIVDVNIRRLRAKIEDNSSKPKYIETVWGTGYRWNSN
ncbi:response regulator transcription factor [Parvimonas micra]|uniref:response regulator transcription factor n=1 Tax=Parvimonas TaxID=543311 RepID=UPI00020DDA61|nr:MULTISPECIES: response regulator transcription factor [unclassified Parvimonas]EGL38846.1 response regulator receiver domain protein [Parvimonas sp. oral taxon 110 str. F0139]MBF1299463.1 response regulator transcription factor [Parvimonas sp.]MEB3011520.1 response regulator transcription factor [Parvimonas sp. D2]MEB3087012.1 response regulator transcription factor [Parvimonas sp. D4]